MKFLYCYNTKIGRIRIAEENRYITNIYFENKELNLDNYEILETDLIKEASVQINEYLNGKRKKFNLPIKPNGRDFKLSVWNRLLEIPYGETNSYKDIAISIENPKACRAVGLANNTNPIPIIIPCHRVIGSNKKLVGYAGGLKIKQFLLDLESENR